MDSAADDRAGMRIGELARRTATSARSLRHYEKRGLITAHREHNGYRRYAPDVVDAVHNIRFLLGAGLSLDDIAQFGTCVRAADLDAAPCAAALAVHEHRLATLDTKIATLEHLRATLAARTDQLRAQLRG